MLFAQGGLLRGRSAAYCCHSVRFAGEDGLQIVRRLVVQAAAALARDGIFVFEFGAGQDQAVEAIVEAVPSLTLLDVKHDLQDIPRAAVAQKTGRT